MPYKTCKICNLEKHLDFFPRERRKNDWYYSPQCKLCMNSIKKEYRNNYRILNKDLLNNNKKIWYNKNKDRIIKKNTEYKKNNRSKYNANRKKRCENDPSFKLRTNVSCIIKQALKQNKSSKNGKSCLDYLGYKIEDLKLYIENQFESWMTWSNHGKYSSETWIDDDQSTWNIDHIIPQSSLPYTSMEDENFKKCWALSNLRPYPAKQNIIEGAARVRHRKLK